MHSSSFEPPSDPSGPLDPNLRTPWYRELNRYHWFVLVVAALGWLFDCLDQQLFILARQPAMNDLLPAVSDPAQFKVMVDTYSTYATSIFLIGWASGGLLFGVMGDRLRRREDDADHDSRLLALYGAECDFRELLGFCALSLPHRAGCGR